MVDFTVRRVTNGWIVQWYTNANHFGGANQEFLALDVEAVKRRIDELLTQGTPIAVLPEHILGQQAQLLAPF